MPLGANSYGSVAGVVAFTRHLLDGESTFNATTVPTLSEVEAMLDRASAALNLALAAVGLGIPVAQADAKLACDEWVIGKTAGALEMTRQTVGWSGEEGRRQPVFNTLANAAKNFAQDNRLAFIRLGVSETHSAGEGLVNPGATAKTNRADRTNADVAQPAFERGMMDE